MQPRDQQTRKEIHVATLVWEGLTNRDIAKVIGTTEQVVKNYLRTAFDKLGVWSRLELALYIASHGGVNWVAELGLDAGLQGAEAELSRVLTREDRGGGVLAVSVYLFLAPGPLVGRLGGYQPHLRISDPGDRGCS